MNKIDTVGLKNKDVDQVFEALLKDAEEELDYKTEVKEHKSIPMLNKYLYRWSDGVEKIERRSEEMQHEQNAKPGDPNLLKLGLTLLGDGAPSAASTPVKLESPILAEIQAKLPTLVASKKVLALNLQQGQDMQTELQVKAFGDNAISSKVLEMKGAMSALVLFLDEIRSHEATCKYASGGMASDQLKSLLDTMKELIEKGIAHQEGFRMMQKRLKGFLVS